jgi:hypothetical protein
LKPLQLAPKGERELNFYQHIFQSESYKLNEDDLELKKINVLAKFHGCYKLDQIIYIKIDDLAYGMDNPGVIDVKIGIETYDPEASIEQIKKHKIKFPFLEMIGFQIEGMRFLNEGKFIHLDKDFCRNLNKNNILDVLALFFQFQKIPKKQVIIEILNKLNELECFFKKQTTYHLFSSSILVAYDYLNENQSKFKIICADFAHVFPANNKKDENYLYGLQSFINHLNELLKPSYKFIFGIELLNK